MSVELFALLHPWLLVVFGAIVSVLIWLIKRFVERVKKMEDYQSRCVTREECRDLIDNRLNPVTRQLEKLDQKLDAKLDKIYDVLIDRKDDSK